MPYLLISDFAAGVDLRKSASTAPAGTLRSLKNATITAGGEIEKRKTITSLGTLPANISKGLAFVGGNILVFGLTPSGSVTGLPPYVTYQQLAVAGPEAIDRVLDVQIFAGKVYVVVRFVGGAIRHYYDGAIVSPAQVQGTSIRAHKTKLYATDGANLRFSAVKSATDWTVGAGNGIIDVTVEDANETDIIGLEEYFGALALFGRTTVQIWSMDPDPALNNIQQVLGNTGLVARNAVARFGSGDVLFLSDTGIRSLRARDIQSAAAVNDIGAPVDGLIAPRRAVLTADLADKLTALVDPLTGHFWLVWGNEVIVLAAYPQSKVSAWSVFDFALPVDYITQANSRVVIRSGEDLFIYGSVPVTGNPFDPNTPVGMSDALYDASPVELITPFLDVSRPATVKLWEALDVACTGTWKVYVCPDIPRAGTEPVWTLIATVTDQTWQSGSLPIEMTSTHMAIRLVSSGAGAATVSSVALHHDLGEES